MSSSISFKIQAPPRPSSSNTRPSQPAPQQRLQQRPHHVDDDDDDDDADADADDALAQRAFTRKAKDELVTAFDRNGATQSVLIPIPPKSPPSPSNAPTPLFFSRKNPRQSTSSPLVIAALPNKDWREAAELIKKKKNKARYIPDAVGGMRLNSDAIAPSTSRGEAMDVDADQINSKPVVAGLSKLTPRATTTTTATTTLVEREPSPEASSTTVTAAPQTEEQRALNELISSASGLGNGETQPSFEVIYSAADARNAPIDESDAFKRDLETRPDQVRILPLDPIVPSPPPLTDPTPLLQSTLEDYARVPVGEFGAAMLRGMGWKPGQAASRSGRSGPVEAFVPKSRPAMLGIGAKPIADVLGSTEASKGKGVVKSSKREDMKFVPLAKKVRAEQEGPSTSTSAGRSGGNGNGQTNGSRTGGASSREVGSREALTRDEDRDTRDKGSDRYEEFSSSSRRDRYRDDGRDRESGPTREKERERERGFSSRYNDERGSPSMYPSSRSDRDRDRDRGYTESNGRQRDRSSSPRRDSERDRDGRRDRNRDRNRDKESGRDEGRVRYRDRR
ncbi:BZ3500_MvSof-1268-A1-R1_Chr8-2g10159 [Microbotryum saponariae]|uniref:BZ3500_MvSof-1268-A1-R1_Chr8-2g10159 protein n=1 Tax=Microbotryum saponariae TaxID=289078 RepID=A0A2X0LA25_9BASI|nr:BZ3500_MvSof-1268-A1-R1_Chr8-2g10159 [Microbotryum saponariae]SDA01900.1 BZ3501_MvSof-1269-A2-R1_Chr8-2g09910 [Microbotryum saponariae]